MHNIKANYLLAMRARFEFTASPQGRTTLHTLCQDPEIARTRAHIRGYVERARAREGWIEH
jgi:hypothetical protein